MKSQLSTKIKALAIYQIIGGILGFVFLFLLLDFRNSSLIWLILLPFIFVLFTYSIYCGIVLLKNVSKGLIHSKVNQFLQVVSFMAFGYAYQYMSGAFISVGLNFTDALEFNFNFGLSHSAMGFNTNDPDLQFSINLIAIFLIVFIDKAQ